MKVFSYQPLRDNQHSILKRRVSASQAEKKGHNTRCGLRNPVEEWEDRQEPEWSRTPGEDGVRSQLRRARGGSQRL